MYFKRISEIIISEVRKDILLGKYKEDAHIKEVEISEKYNISRGPVREMLSQLENENLVKRLKNGRVIVSDFNFEDVRDLYDVRRLLEMRAIDYFKKYNDINDVKKIRENFNKMKDNRNILKNDFLFHKSIVDASKNKTLITLWTSLQGLIETILEITSEFLDEYPTDILKIHENIIELIEQNDFDSAKAVLGEHIDHASELYSGVFEKMN